MSRLAERLAKKIGEELGIVCRPETFRRTYAGYWMKTQGAFVWEMDTESGAVLGSMYPASVLVRSGVRLTINPDGEIFPDEF